MKMTSLDLPPRLTLQDIIKLADPITNVIILEGNVTEDRYLLIFRNLDSEYWDDSEAFGPTCHLCDEEIIATQEKLTYNGSMYTVIWEDEVTSDEWDVDTKKRVNILQCVYCLNFYHKVRCNVEMSTNSYLHIVKNRQWACPTCVPEFKISNVNVLFNLKKAINVDKLMNKLAKLLNPLLIKNFESVEVRFTFLCNIRHLLCKIATFELNDPG